MDYCIIYLSIRFWAQAMAAGVVCRALQLRGFPFEDGRLDGTRRRNASAATAAPPEPVLQDHPTGLHTVRMRMRMCTPSRSRGDVLASGRVCARAVACACVLPAPASHHSYTTCVWGMQARLTTWAGARVHPEEITEPERNMVGQKQPMALPPLFWGRRMF